MCGIVGGFGTKIDSKLIEQGIRLMANRGPDHQQVRVISKICVMGSTRLAMTDPLPRSNQPFIMGNNEHAITFNGEIYNYLELREGLIKEGHDFSTDSDTEVLIKLLATRGVRALSEIKGMFAFVYYNNNTKTIIAARDSLGKKPLYYKWSNGNFLWSSNAKILTSLPSSTSLELNSTSDFLALGYLLDPNTSYADVKSLLPGHFLEIKEATENIILKRFTVNFDCLTKSNNLKEVLWKAIQDRTAGHNKVAISLSGGIDSTLVALGLRDLGVITQAFSAYWSDSDKARYNSDSVQAEQIAKKLGHEFIHVDISEKFDLESSLREYLVAMDEPNNNPTGISAMLLYKRISETNHRLLLTGDGSDEIFGGYSRYTLANKIPSLGLNMKKISVVFLPQKENSFRKAVSNLITSQLDAANPISWLYWHWVFTPAEMLALYPKFNSNKNILDLISTQIQNLIEKNSIKIRSQALMKFDHEIWLTMESNKKLDRLTMNYSIEARSPFQDEDVVHFAHQLLSKSKYKKLNKTELVKSFPELSHLPVKEKKDGFISPVGHWLRTNQEFVRQSLKYLESQNEWDKQEIRKFEGVQFSGNHRKNMQLWSLIVISNWLRIQNNE